MNTRHRSLLEHTPNYSISPDPHWIMRMPDDGLCAFRIHCGDTLHIHPQPRVRSKAIALLRVYGGSPIVRLIINTPRGYILWGFGYAMPFPSHCVQILGEVRRISFIPSIKKNGLHIGKPSS